MEKIAILQCADTGPVESLVVMLTAAGYSCYLPDRALRDELRNIGCDTVLEIDSLVRGMGYERPMDIPEATRVTMHSASLFVDIKAHRNYPAVVGRWPNLKGKVLWYRINGGKPEHVIKPSGEDCGDEINPPCPILTPNLWYKDCGECQGRGGHWNGVGLPRNDWDCESCRGTGRYPKAYAVWPPFYRFQEYYDCYGRKTGNYASPVCLIHNLAGWGYGALIDNIRRLGVKCYGDRSADGLIKHEQIPDLLSKSLAMVHLKSSDAPGYALYEALAAACPVVLTRRLIWRNRMQDLFESGVTCLVFDRETHEGLSAADVDNCTAEVREHLAALEDPDLNRTIGLAGYNRLKEVMWDQHNSKDVDSLQDFFSRNYT